MQVGERVHVQARPQICIAQLGGHARVRCGRLRAVSSGDVAGIPSGQQCRPRAAVIPDPRRGIRSGALQKGVERFAGQRWEVRGDDHDRSARRTGRGELTPFGDRLDQTTRGVEHDHLTDVRGLLQRGAHVT